MTTTVATAAAPAAAAAAAAVMVAAEQRAMEGASIGGGAQQPPQRRKVAQRVKFRSKQEVPAFQRLRKRVKITVVAKEDIPVFPTAAAALLYICP